MAAKEEPNFVAAVVQVMNDCEAVEELKGVGQRLVREQMSDEQRLALRDVYHELTVALKLREVL